MIAEFGVAALCFALVCAGLLTIHPKWPLTGDRPLMLGVAGALTLSFVCLVGAFMLSDFSVFSVFMHSHSAKPMIYKITATWGHHEGSMLLWVWFLGALGAGLALSLPATRLRSGALAVLGATLTGFIAFILLTSNPFARIFPPPMAGKGLNPLLQDIGLAIHPPLLYLGYVGFGIVFAIAVGALLTRTKIDGRLAQVMRPWALLAWSFLSLGIGVGSWWAYRELGWGGWWFWDPVENVSLLPWLSGTALVHCLLVLSRKPALQNWTVLLAILTFTFSLLGTFLVRSGLLTSVHSFASDPTRGLFILAFIAILTGSALWLFARRSQPSSSPDFLPFSREGFILLNNLFLCVLCATIFLGIVYPLVMDALDAPAISVGAPYYHQVFVPLALPLVLLAGFGPLLAWRQASWKSVRKSIYLALAIMVGLVMVWRLVADAQDLLALGGWAMGAWLLAATLAYAYRRFRHNFKWQQDAPVLLTHAGLALLVLAATAVTTLRQDGEFVIETNAPQHFAGFEWQVQKTERGRQDNYMFQRAIVTFEREDGTHTTLKPESRFYPVRGMETAEAAIRSTWFADLYATVHVQQPPEDAKPVTSMPPLMLKLHYIPGQQWLWMSFILLFTGGIIASIQAFRHLPR